MWFKEGFRVEIEKRTHNVIGCFKNICWKSHELKGSSSFDFNLIYNS
jgi:hypothetical protein